MSPLRREVVSALVLLLALGAHASDGRLEINQACATGTGCFSGDAAGFPVSITQPGSYVLTSDLEVAALATGINVAASASGSTLDLNGFHIRGPVVCTGSGATLDCGSGGGASAAISAPSLAERVTIHDGTVQGFGIGIGGQKYFRIERVTARWNSVNGIFVGPGSLVADCVARENRANGIVAAQAVVVGSFALGNRGAGFSHGGVGGESLWASSAAVANGGSGFATGFGSLVSGSHASLNVLDGILAGNGSLVTGSSSGQNDGDAIQAAADAFVVRNVAAGPGASGVGLRFGVRAAYRENVVSNDGSPNVAGGVNAGDNVCGAGICP